MFALCWFPVFFNHYLWFVRPDQVHPFAKDVQLVITWIADANSAINPCFYILLKVAGTSFLARGGSLTIARHARKTRDKKRLKIRTNMAARGVFPARLLLSCFKQISRISETVSTITTLVNSLCSRQIVSSVQC